MSKEIEFEVEQCLGGWRILAYLGKDSEVVIPETYQGKPIVEIGEEIFANTEVDVEKVVLSPNIKKICHGAFKYSLALEEVVMVDGLEVIEDEIFFVTSVTKIHIPASVREIVSAYDLAEFEWSIDTKSPYYKTDGTGIYQHQEDGWHMVAMELQSPTREYHVLEDCVAIDQSAFCGNDNLEKVLLPGSIKSIGADAFESCIALREVNIPEGVEQIDNGAFRGCTSLKEIHLPKSLKELCVGALNHTFNWNAKERGFQRVTIEEDNPCFAIDEQCFYRKCPEGLSLMWYFGKGSDYRVSEKVWRIEEGSFFRGGLKKLTLPSSLCYVEKGAFEHCEEMDELVLEDVEISLYIPRIPLYRRDEILSFLEGEKKESIYDFAAYDKAWESYRMLEEKATMAASRLLQDKVLAQDAQERYRDYMKENLNQILEDISTREDEELLSMLCRSYVIDKDNIDGAIEVFASALKPRLSGILFEWKEEEIGFSGFDFSL